MRIGDAAATALANLGRRKGRTSLTVTGVVIGVGTLVLMVSLGLGLQQAVRAVFESEKALRSIFVTRPTTGTKKPRKGLGGISPFGGQTIPLSDADVEELRKLEGAEFVVPNLNLWLDAEIKDVEDAGPVPWVLVGGAVAGEEAWLRGALKAGRIWNSRDEKAVLVPTRYLAGKFNLEPEQALGKRIVFSKGGTPEGEKPPEEELSFTIVGVIETDKVGLRATGLFVPIELAAKLRELSKGGYLPGKAGTYVSCEITGRDTKDLVPLKNRLKNLGYDVVTAADIVETVNTLFLIINGFFGAIGAIGLLVSLLGIANTMAMAVLERTREIGILKAVGARISDVRRIYLMEAGAIGLIGGLLGLVGGLLLGTALDAAAHAFVSQIPPEVRLFRVPILLGAGALVFSTAVSMLAGLLPALRASRLDPVKALRYE